MNEPLKISIEKQRLVECLLIAESGISPKVVYLPGEDRRMLDDAYEARGLCLEQLQQRIQDLLR